MDNEKMHITTGFYSADLFHGWEDSDIELYDEADSAEKYASLIEAAIKADYPEAEIEVLYQSGATGELPHALQTRVNDIDVAGSGNEALDAERIDDIVGKIYAEYEWCVKKE